MKIPEPILQFLKGNKIVTPTPIQLQGIPTAYGFIPCGAFFLIYDVSTVSLVAI
jgi:hypothetical protein